MSAPRPIRILRIITRLNIGGPAIHAILLSRRLSAPDYDSLLVTGHPAANEGDMSGLLEGSGVRRVIVPALKRRLSPWADLQAWWSLFQLIRREGPDIVHTHMAKAGALGRTAAMAANALARVRRRLTGHPASACRILHTFHGHVLDGYFSASVSRLFVMIEGWLSRGTDTLIAVSPAIRDALLGKGIGRPEQWRVIPLGLDLTALAQLPVSNGAAPVRVGLIGRLVPIKNPSLFLSAFDQLRRRTSTVPVEGRVIGDGPLRSSLEQEAKRPGLGSLVQFTGWQQDLRAVYQQLEATCLTSWNEGTPVAIIEAMAAGRAVIATDVGGVRNVLEDAERPLPIPKGGFRATQRGILVRPGDSGGLAAALVAVAENRVLRAQLGQAARAYAVQRFSEERLCRDITSLYASLITNEGGGT